MQITKAEKAAYNDYIKEYHKEIDDLKKRIKELANKKKRKPAIAAYYNLEIIIEQIKIITLYISMSDASMEMLHIKNESFLNHARKDVYKLLQELEEIVGNETDRSLKENEDYLQRIEKVNPKQILNIIRSIHKIINILIKKMGEGSKWKWSFVDIQGRIAVATKNIINFSDIQRYRDPRSDYYLERQELLKLCKSSLNESAKQYRNRYEISTKVPSDMLKSIDLLSALRKINLILGRADEADKLKDTIDALRVRLEADEKQKEGKKESKQKK